MPNSKIYKEMNNERGEANKWKKKKETKKTTRRPKISGIIFFLTLLKC